MNYSQAIEKLRNNHIYPVVQKEIGKDNKERIIGLEVQCNSLTFQSRKEHIENVLGKGWKVDWMGANHDYILITNK